MRCLLVFAIVLGSCATTPSSGSRTVEPLRCGRLGERALGARPIDLLDGRLTIRLPEGAELSADDDARTEEESAVVLDAGADRLVLLAEETFALAGPDLASAAARVLPSFGGGPGKVEVVELPSGLRAAILIPDSPAIGRALMLLTVLVAHPDGTTQRLGIAVDAGKAPEREGCIELARRIVGTLAVGPRALERDAATRTLALDDGEALELDHPAGWILTAGPSSNARSFMLRKPVGYDLSAPIILIAWGPKPNHQDNPAAIKGPGKLLGATVDWQMWAKETEGLVSVFMDALAPDPARPGYFVYVVIAAPDKDTLNEARAIAESLRRK
jgi:hypothetical protein